MIQMKVQLAGGGHGRGKVYQCRYDGGGACWGAVGGHDGAITNMWPANGQMVLGMHIYMGPEALPAKGWRVQGIQRLGRQNKYNTVDIGGDGGGSM